MPENKKNTPDETWFDTEEILTPDTEIQISENVTTIEATISHTRMARGVQVVAGEVTNILAVVADEEDRVVGFDIPYGTELFVVEDNSPIAIGWTYVDGQFINPFPDEI